MTAKMKKMLQTVKANLILRHDQDDALLLGYIAAAVNYAETYQHLPEGHYARRGIKMPAATEQAIVMLSSHFFESRDGSTGGFFADSVPAAAQVWNTANRLLAMNKSWPV